MERKQYLDTTVDGRKVMVEVYYVKGDSNCYGRGTARGYYLSTAVVDLKQERGYTSVSMELFNNGGRQLVKEVKRQSDKQFEEAIILSKPMVLPMVMTTLAQRKDGLKLETETEKQLTAGVFKMFNQE